MKKEIYITVGVIALVFAAVGFIYFNNRKFLKVKSTDIQKDSETKK